MRAKLQDYYKDTSQKTIFERVKSLLLDARVQLKKTASVLDQINKLEKNTLIAEPLYTHANGQLSNAVNSVFQAKYSDVNYDTSMALKKNVSLFAAHKSAYFTEWARGASREEQQAILTIYQRQLVVEKNLASRASRAVKQWQRIEHDKETYPTLEYLPSRSVARRENHTRYYGMVLPVGDAFWSTGLPPNGWGCKCRVRQSDAPATKYLSPPKPTKGIAGNAGKELAVFTTNHPFFNNLTESGKQKLVKEWRKIERNSIKKWALSNIRNKKFDSEKGNVGINGTGIKEIINQNHNHYWEKNQLLFNIKEVIKTAKYVKIVPFDTNKKGADVFSEVYYFKTAIKKEDSYLVMRKQNEKNGGKLMLYDIVEILK